MSKETYNAIAANFDAVHGLYDSTHRIFSAPIAEMTVRLAGIGPGQEVLDACCGTGAATVPAAAAVIPGGHVTGLDISAGMLEVARDRCRGLPVTLTEGDAASLPFSGEFDVIICSLGFYLLPDPEEAARQWLARLRPGGKLVFSWQMTEDPLWEEALAAADRHVPEGRPRFGDMLRHYPLTSAGEMHAFLRQAGYHDVCTICMPIPATYASPSQWWESGFQRARRISWQHIPDKENARHEVMTLLEPLRNADGSITRTPLYGITRAHG